MDKKFTRFKLNNEWSADLNNSKKDFNAFIVHDGVLELFNTPSFSNEIVFPHLGENSHFLGVQNEGLELSYNMLVKEVAMEGYRKFLAWLDFKHVKKIYFDYDHEDDDEDPTRYRTVKVSNISRGEIWPVGNCEDSGQPLYNIKVEVSFITVGDWAVVDEKWTQNQVPVNTNTESPFTNNTDLPMYFIINVSGGDFELKRDGATLIKRDGGGDPFTYDTRTGILYDWSMETPEGERTSLFKGVVEQEAFTFLLEPGDSVDFSLTEDSVDVYVYAVKRYHV